MEKEYSIVFVKPGNFVVRIEKNFPWAAEFDLDTLEENAALCEALGLRFIELNMNFPEYQVDRLEQTDELVRIAEQHHLYYTVHLDENLNIADFNPLVTKAYLETVRRTNNWEGSRWA